MTIASIDVAMVAQRPTGDFAYDRLELRALTDDQAEVDILIGAFHAIVAEHMPDATRQPVIIAPAPVPLPFAARRPMPAPAVLPAPAAFGPPAMDLAYAERLTSPCGESKGQPLCSCTDSDLEYLATRYKKPGELKTAAAVVLAARRMNQTAQHY